MLYTAAVIQPASAGVVGDLQPQVAALELYSRADRQALSPWPQGPDDWTDWADWADHTPPCPGSPPPAHTPAPWRCWSGRCPRCSRAGSLAKHYPLLLYLDMFRTLKKVVHIRVVTSLHKTIPNWILLHICEQSLVSWGSCRVLSQLDKCTAASAALNGQSETETSQPGGVTYI